MKLKAFPSTNFRLIAIETHRRRMTRSKHAQQLQLHPRSHALFSFAFPLLVEAKSVLSRYESSEFSSLISLIEATGEKSREK